MAKVQVLSTEVISRIAAGEVVDRPSSVVKELMENALDAGATRVEILLRSGGKTLIRVRDNGSGIAREDLDQLFTRHATSKIRSADDLEALISFGFRGEALYSIAAVSEVTVRTRTAEGDEGWELHLKGGRRERISPAAISGPGTEISVGEIFFNTPARKKFLKSDSSELDAVLQVFLPYALKYPERHFVLVHNDRTIYDLAPDPSFGERAARTLKLERSAVLEETFSLPGRAEVCRCVLGDINIQRPRRDIQYLFVNGRPVQHRNLSFHLNDVYRMIMPEGVHPFFVLFLQLPPEDVDVNIHPQKREVRIRGEAEIFGALRSAVERALMTRGTPRQIAETSLFPFGPSGASTIEGIPGERIIFGPGAVDPSERRDLPVPGERPGFFTQETRGDMPEVPSASLGVSVCERLERLRFLGTFASKYHLFEEGEGLIVVDQHAAQERILFERFLDQAARGEVEVQHLLIPQLVKLPPGDMLRWEACHAELEALGLLTARLDEETVSVNAIPGILKGPEALLRAVVADGQGARFDREAFARRACRASVMAGDRMSAAEAVHQMQALAACRDPMTCPHGRPVFIEIKTSFLDRQFFRTA
ncbi:MAG: DNA mismatch repair endonuclease MutL [Elusimicrobia bacterium]|nr:DNA mismatch repair endonuclease MutL [Elusimicrobiota bacterium]